MSIPRIEIGYTGNTKHQVATRKMVSVENEVAKKKTPENSEIIAKRVLDLDGYHSYQAV